MLCPALQTINWINQSTIIPEELIDNALRRIGEIAELRFPNNKRIRVGHRVSMLEAKHGVLGQRRVAHRVWRLRLRDVLERVVSAILIDC